jgi:ribosome maturation factor RimP
MGEQPYTLEVTSRGLDRPLTLARHWRRNIGHLVVAELADGSRLRGRITGYADDEVDVTVDGRSRRLALADVATARIEPELKRPRPERKEA